MESEHVKGTIEHVREHPQAKYEDSKILVEAKTRDLTSASSVSSSSSSSRSSSEFDIDETSPFDDSTAKSKSDGDQLCGRESVSSPDFTAHTPQWSMLSASPPVGIEEHLSQMKSPPVQTMGHPAGYDPNRIPASIFSTKVTNTSDWSVASNDSLFSIHMGNNSFSRDYMFGKSGELSRLDEWNNSQSLYVSEAKYNELSSLPSSLPPVMEVSAHEECSVNSSKISGLEKEESSNSLKVASVATKGALPAESTTLTSSCTPRLSDESGRSSSSFAFPV